MKWWGWIFWIILLRQLVVWSYNLGQENLLLEIHERDQQWDQYINPPLNRWLNPPDGWKWLKTET